MPPFVPTTNIHCTLYMVDIVHLLSFQVSTTGNNTCTCWPSHLKALLIWDSVVLLCSYRWGWCLVNIPKQCQCTVHTIQSSLLIQYGPHHIKMTFHFHFLPLLWFPRSTHMYTLLETIPSVSCMSSLTLWLWYDSCFPPKSEFSRLCHCCKLEPTSISLFTFLLNSVNVKFQIDAAHRLY